MKRILFVLLILIASGCKPQQYITPIKEETVITYKDSTIYHQDTVHIELVHEAYNYYTSLQDTLRLETEYSIAHAYIDTALHLLSGNISNKKVTLPVVIEYKDRIITNDTTIYKDKPIYIEVTNKKAERQASVWKWLFMMVTAIALALGIEIIIEKIFKK